MKLPKYPNVKGYWKETKRLLESQAYNELSLNQLKILKYLYLSLKWKKVNNRIIATNNGKVSVAHSMLRKKLGINSSETTTKAIRKLISVGFIEITKYPTIHSNTQYKILIQSACNRGEENWKQYPQKNWSDRVVKKSSMIKNGENTYKENFKSKPKQSLFNSSDKPSEIGVNNG